MVMSGFPNGAQRFFPGARFGEGSGRVLLSDVNCAGNESNLLECENVQGNWVLSDCQHGSDVGVKCSAPNFEGCFSTGLLQTIDGFTVADMALEKCFSFCVPGGYRYIWIHMGTSCDCGNEIDGSKQVDIDECSIQCPEGTYCPAVTSVSNGNISTTASVPYTVGAQIRIMCNPGFMAYDDEVFCQADGRFNRDIRFLSVVSIVAVITVVFLIACLVRIRKRRYANLFCKRPQRLFPVTLPSRSHKDGTCVNEGVSSSLSVSSQHSLGYEIPLEVTLGGYHRNIINTGNSQDKQNGYYYMENDPNNQTGFNNNSKLDQDYEHVQL
ncbi:Galectin-3-binding protein B [Holothuria leucospilota]|uniref:Galectin-3-binding protein B n=1 Tax=Holothuria leucospilota TaxID=206669 RepID=A0A9Q1H565_HOLLE|nr:Galectin-3-binding protein B [Holothuria leucospilota]